MPYPNEHAARIKDPAGFDRFAREEISAGISAILGITKDGKSEIQSYRFDRWKFSPAEARTWLKDNGIETTDFEPAENSENFKGVEVAEITGVEVCRTGIWNGYPMTEATLDEMVSNFEAGIIEPWLNLDHNDSFTDRVKDALKVVGLGFVSALRRQGDRLIADFKQVPKKIAELIQSGALKKRSIEFYPKWKQGGSLFANVLRAVSFFGADIPAVNGLSDDMGFLMKTSFNSKMPDDQAAVTLTEVEENNMATTTIDTAELEQLRTFKGKHEASEAELAKLKADVATKDAKITELEKFKTDAATAAAAALKTEADAFVIQAIKDGKVLARFKDQYIQDYLAKHAAGGEALKLFKEDVNGRNKVVNLGQLRDEKGNPTKLDLKTATSEQINDAVEALMSAENLTYQQAAEKLNIPGFAKTT